MSLILQYHLCRQLFPSPTWTMLAQKILYYEDFVYLQITFLCLVEWTINSFLIFLHIRQFCSSISIALQLSLCFLYINSKSWPYCFYAKDRKQGNWKEIPIPVDYLWTMVECGKFFIDCGIYGLLPSVVNEGRCNEKCMKLTFRNN